MHAVFALLLSGLLLLPPPAIAQETPRKHERFERRVSDTFTVPPASAAETPAEPANPTTPLEELPETVEQSEDE